MFNEVLKPLDDSSCPGQQAGVAKKRKYKKTWVRKQGVDSSLPIKQYWWKCKGYVIHKKNGHKAVCKGNVTERFGAVFSIYQLTPGGIAIANLHKLERQTVFWEWPLYVIGLYSRVVALFTKCCCQWHVWGRLGRLGGGRCSGFGHTHLQGCDGWVLPYVI